MPAPPLIKSPRGQRAVVAIAMVVVLLGSLGLAQLATSAAMGSPMGPRLKQRTTLGLDLAVPRWWVEDQSANQQFGSSAQLWVDPTRPQTRLLVQFSDAGYNNIRAVLMDYESRALPDMIRTDRPDLSILQYPTGREGMGNVGILWTAERDPRLQHFITVIQLPNNPRQYWVLHLIDTAGPDEDPRKVFFRNAVLMSKILQETRLR